jgi:hypothetical protein
MLYRYENHAHNKATNQISNRSAVDAGKSDTFLKITLVPLTKFHETLMQ